VRRGDIVTLVVPGDYGKPRPALIVQADEFAKLPSVTVLPLTSELFEASLLRVTVQPQETTGLRKLSQIMIDKLYTIPRSKVGNEIGRVNTATMATVDRAMTAFLGLASPGDVSRNGSADEG
jgi:mRNA interferase MazF